MNLINFLHPKCILTHVTVSSPEELIHLQAEAIHTQLATRGAVGISLPELEQKLLAREMQESTGLGNGIAVPHTRIPAFSHIGLSIAVLDTPLEFKAIDHQPIQISSMVVAPSEYPNLVMKIWSTLAKLLNDPAVKSFFMHADSATQLMSYLHSKELKLNLDLSASDLMFKPALTFSQNLQVSEATAQMYQHKEQCVAVLDDEGCFLGEVTSDAIFKYGMPEFFKQLQSVSFLRHFNPLEKYFAHENTLSVKDILSSDCATIMPDATLIEVLFQISVKNHMKLYVVNKQGLLCGEIHRLSILNRAINF